MGDDRISVSRSAHRQAASAVSESSPPLRLVEIGQHFKRPSEHPFTAEQRKDVTILFGGLTWKHEAFIQAVFQGAGYKCQRVPTPDIEAYRAGREYANQGQCNPAYFTLGSLIRHLRSLEAQGLSRRDIVDKYVFFTAGGCGPCRFGMYESEYRHALQSAGFDGFRILLFQQDHGINAATGEQGLKFNVDFGLGMLNAVHLGDVIYELGYRIRPFEVHAGETDRAIDEAVAMLSRMLRQHPPFEIMDAAPRWTRDYLTGHDKLHRTLNTVGKIRKHLYGKEFLETLDAARERLNQVETDPLRVRPVVKITGEFWAQMTEGDGNFRMFEFLEREGAQVLVEPIATWVAYLLHQAGARAGLRRDVELHHARLRWWQWRSRLAQELALRKKTWLFSFGEGLWTYFYERAARRLGGLSHPLLSQPELARLAHPFFHRMARGGEGHLEVGKSIYYTRNRLCHMILALKPFGCMPSAQSDGVHAAVVSRYPDMIFLPVETSGEGEINAHSRVQMALGEAKGKAKAEFDAALETSGKRLQDIRAYVDRHPEMRRPFYRLPQQNGVAGRAAQFVLHVSQRMDRGR